MQDNYKDTFSNVAQGKKTVAETLHSNFGHSLPKIFIRNLSYTYNFSLTPSILSMHVIHTRGYALIPTQAIRKWIYLSTTW